MSRRTIIEGRVRYYERKKAIDERREQERNEGIPVAREPGIDGLPLAVDYDTRGVGDVVLSGPLLGFSGRGRVFVNPEAALEWGREKYGPDRVSLINLGEDSVRWTLLVKNLRK